MRGRLLNGCMLLRAAPRLAAGGCRFRKEGLRRVESHRYRPFSTTISINMDALSSLSIKPLASVDHAPATSPAEWKQALDANAATPANFELIKTLVFKPKTAKTATTVPVVVIARDETETVSGALGKKLNLKELRLASADLLTEFFSSDKDSG